MQGEVKLPKPTWTFGTESGKRMERFLRDALLYSNSNSSNSSGDSASESTAPSESTAATVSVVDVDA